MPNEEWGVKRACPKCATRFYDLNKDPMICPSCAHSFTLASILEQLSGRSGAKAKAAEAKAAAEADDDVDLLDDSDDDVDPGDELLEDDDDDTVSLDDIADVASKDDES
ncbi:TIGR02300 family protein [Abyssibius alkaniclasticus]|uniref:TIGR02300 family protein n=1 Tax=Abyssibius alkaniclasticus TaxID=2881234 RepID=UPI002363B729|nr:TIGR02300 family protein [Abyssibius alkaniclasticus]UPH71726.1 TIGR02300 family protein [Abyssibius alkaniclasticus]|tara:strand:- start:228 stop:554 length:327 start_codon:yes stop_codon:yes gene_type:complete